MKVLSTAVVVVGVLLALCVLTPDQAQGFDGVGKSYKGYVNGCYVTATFGLMEYTSMNYGPDCHCRGAFLGSYTAFDTTLLVLYSLHPACYDKATSLVYDYIINSTAIWVSSAVVNASFWLNDITNNTYAGIWNAYEQTHGLNELVVIYPPLFGSYYPTSGRWTGIYGLFDVANNVVYYELFDTPPFVAGAENNFTAHLTPTTDGNWTISVQLPSSNVTAVSINRIAPTTLDGTYFGIYKDTKCAIVANLDRGLFKSYDLPSQNCNQIAQLGHYIVDWDAEVITLYFALSSIANFSTIYQNATISFDSETGQLNLTSLYFDVTLQRVSAPPAYAKVSLTLNANFSAWSADDLNAVIADICAATGLTNTSIIVLGVSAGSVILDLAILNNPYSTVSSASVVSTLQTTPSLGGFNVTGVTATTSSTASPAGMLSSSFWLLCVAVLFLLASITIL